MMAAVFDTSGLSTGKIRKVFQMVNPYRPPRDANENEPEIATQPEPFLNLSEDGKAALYYVAFVAFLGWLAS